MSSTTCKRKIFLSKLLLIWDFPKVLLGIVYEYSSMEDSEELKTQYVLTKPILSKCISKEYNLDEMENRITKTVGYLENRKIGRQVLFWVDESNYMLVKRFTLNTWIKILYEVESPLALDFGNSVDFFCIKKWYFILLIHF